MRRLEKDNEGLTKELMAAQNTDLQFANVRILIAVALIQLMYNTCVIRGKQGKDF